MPVRFGEAANRVEDPEQRSSEVAFSAFATAFQSGEERIEVLLAPQADADRKVDFSVQHVVRFVMAFKAVTEELPGKVCSLSGFLPKWDRVYCLVPGTPPFSVVCKI
jgi:hypothetical protein